MIESNEAKGELGELHIPGYLPQKIKIKSIES